MDGWMMDGLVFPSWFNTRRALSTLFYKKTRASSPPGLVSPDGGTTYSSYHTIRHLGAEDTTRAIGHRNMP
jgi:hypothetical protein